MPSSAHTVFVLAALLAGTTTAVEQATESVGTDQRKVSSGAEEGVVAMVNGSPIRQDMLELWLQRSATSSSTGQPGAGQRRRAVLEGLINRELMAQEAIRTGLDKNPDVLLELEDQRRSVLAKAWTERWLQVRPIADEELRKAYQDRVLAAAPTEYRGRHILVATAAEALDVINELKAGADFAELAKKKSKDPSASYGGELGWFSQNTIPAPIVDAVAVLKLGQFTPEPVQTKFGWHVVLLEESRTSNVPSFEQAAPSLATQLQREKLRAEVQRLKAEASIETP
jgi:peptidyl-prolyl cis-trans isomerase C